MAIIKLMFDEGQIQHVLFTAVQDLQTTPNATHLSFTVQDREPCNGYRWVLRYLSSIRVIYELHAFSLKEENVLIEAVNEDIPFVCKT